MLLTERKLIICFYSYLQDTTKDPNNNKRINSVSMVTKEYQKITMSHLCYRSEIIPSFCECFLTVGNSPSFSSSNMPEGINYKLGGTRFFSFLSPHPTGGNANPTIDFYLNSTGYRGLSPSLIFFFENKHFPILDDN